MLRASADHHNDFFKPGLSATSINTFFKSPAHFWRTSSFNPQRIRTEATPAMIFGRLAHALILTPDSVAQDFIVTPTPKPGQLVTVNDYKQALAATGHPFKASGSKPELAELVRHLLPHAVVFDDVMKEFELAKGKRDVVSAEDWKKAHDMKDAMFANKAVRQLIGNGMSERPVVWRRGEDMLLCKSKLDYLRDGLVIEYKTTRSAAPDDISRDIATLGYHRQLAWENEAAEALLGDKPRGSIIIAQDSEVFEAIGVYALSRDALAQGRAECDYAYNEIKRRLVSGDWRAFPEEIVNLELPKWYGFKDAAQKAA